MDISYTISFPTFDSQLPPLAYCTQTFVNIPPAQNPASPPPKPPKKEPAPTPPPQPAEREIVGHGKLGYALSILLPPIPAPTPVPVKIPKHVAPSLIGPLAPPIPGAAHISFDMTGGGINLPKDAADIPVDDFPIPLVSSTPPGLITGVRLEPITYNNTWRISFSVLPFPSTADSIELRCQLTLKGKPLSETWDYTLYRPAPQPHTK